MMSHTPDTLIALTVAQRREFLRHAEHDRLVTQAEREAGTGGTDRRRNPTGRWMADLARLHRALRLAAGAYVAIRARAHATGRR